MSEAEYMIFLLADIFVIGKDDDCSSHRFTGTEAFIDERLLRSSQEGR